MESIKTSPQQKGFSLVEIMVALAIGLIVVLVIVQTMSTFEGRKGTTIGGTDAQTSGNIALYLVERQAKMAGYGMPIFNLDSPLSCTNSNKTFDHDGDGATSTPTPELSMTPVTIADGGSAAGASDSITIRWGDGAMAGVPVRITDVANVGTTGTISVTNSMGCKANDVAIIIDGSTLDGTALTCAMRKVSAVPTANTTSITFTSTSATGLATNSKIGCIGAWNQVTYMVSNGSLLANGVPVMSGIVNMQAQYGVSASSTSNEITEWHDAADSWATTTGSTPTPSVTMRNRIKAIRIAIVARSDVRDAANVANAPCSTGVCTWAGQTTAASGSTSSIDLTSNADWQHYRYRVFETTIPLRNVIWASEGLI